MLTHDAVAASARATSERLGVTPDDHWLACLPLAHVGGLAVVTRALVVGTRLTVLPGFDPDAVMAAGATHVSLVATALRRIDPTAFRTIVLGGAAPPADLPPNVVTTYGMTETGSGVVYDGRPLDGVDVRIDDDGEILLRGPMLLRCYRDGSDPARRRLVPDRRPRPLAARTAGCTSTGAPATSSSRAARTSGRSRSRPCCASTPTSPTSPSPARPTTSGARSSSPSSSPRPAPSPTLDDLRATVKEQLPAYCAPRRLVLAESIPRTALGKVRRAELPTPP